MIAMLLACIAVATLQQPPASPSAAAQQAPASPLTPESQHALQTQVMLDRAGFSPGEIDGTLGMNTRRALDAFARAGGKPEPEPVDPLVRYRITDEDVAGPFTPDIPDDLMAQASLPTLGYRNVAEALGERFHASPALLRRLNPGATFVAGEEILVPNVLETVPPVGPPRGRQGAGSNPADVIVTVTRSTSSMTITDGSGHTLFYAPVTTGSEHDPLPIGDWKVVGMRRNPEFRYSPDLFWDADPSHTKATIKPGPNNPVGVVWIEISRPHYGLHGTPAPSKIGKTESHGCVRLTNWDAEKLASLVRPGSRVVFEK